MVALAMLYQSCSAGLWANRSGTRKNLTCIMDAACNHADTNVLADTHKHLHLVCLGQRCRSCAAMGSGLHGSRTESGWKNISRFAEVPCNDLVVKAVVGQSGGHTLAAVRVCLWLPGSSQDEMCACWLDCGAGSTGLHANRAWCHACWVCFFCVEQAAQELCRSHCRPHLA